MPAFNSPKSLFYFVGAVSLVILSFYVHVHRDSFSFLPNYLAKLVVYLFIGFGTLVFRLIPAVGLSLFIGRAAYTHYQEKYNSIGAKKYAFFIIFGIAWCILLAILLVVFSPDSHVH